MSNSRTSQSRGRPDPTGQVVGSTQRLTVLYVASLSAIAGLAIIGQVWIQQAPMSSHVEQRSGAL